nr:hypothetical protein [Tanacetum cinerariifolium]
MFWGVKFSWNVVLVGKTVNSSRDTVYCLWREGIQGCNNTYTIEVSSFLSDIWRLKSDVMFDKQGLNEVEERGADGEITGSAGLGLELPYVVGDVASSPLEEGKPEKDEKAVSLNSIMFLSYCMMYNFIVYPLEMRSL